jgi:hypothetical protein
MKAFENRVLKRGFRRKRDVVTEDWRELCNGGLIMCTRPKIM